jgi:hypothetical protein
MRSVLALLALFVASGVACGDEGGEELSGPAKYTQEKTQYWQVFCTCAAGETEVQPASSSCVRMYTEQGECEEELLEEDWDDLETSAECLVDAYETGTACLQRACGVDRCLGEFGDAIQRCSQDAPEAFAASCN